MKTGESNITETFLWEYILVRSGRLVLQQKPIEWVLQCNPRKETNRPLQVDEVKDLIKAISESEIAEFILEDDSSGVKLVLKKHEAVQAAQLQVASSVGSAPTVAVPQPAAPAESKEQPGEEVYDDANYYTVKAPMVGTFYRAPAPDADPYVQVGDEVTTGQALC